MSARGLLCACIVSVLYGISSVLAKVFYAGGGNSSMYVLLRAALALPLLFFFAYKVGNGLKISKKQVGQITLLGIVGMGTTMAVLAASFNYIPVGMACSLHYIFPMVIAIVSVVIFKEKMTLLRWGVLLLAMLGIATFLEGDISTSWLGITMALLSGFTYAFHLLYLDKSGLKDMEPFCFSFYLCVVMTAMMLVITLVTDTFTLALTPQAWGIAIFVALSISIVAFVLTQISLRLIGAATMSILCLLEPITGLVFGYLLLNEVISPLKLGGCFLVLLAVAILYSSDLIRVRKEEKRQLLASRD